MSDLYMSGLYAHRGDGSDDPDNYVALADDTYIYAVDDQGVQRVGVYAVGAGTLEAHKQRTISSTDKGSRSHVELPILPSRYRGLK